MTFICGDHRGSEGFRARAERKWRKSKKNRADGARTFILRWINPIYLRLRLLGIWAFFLPFPSRDTRNKTKRRRKCFVSLKYSLINLDFPENGFCVPFCYRYRWQNSGMYAIKMCFSLFCQSVMNWIRLVVGNMAVAGRTRKVGNAKKAFGVMALIHFIVPFRFYCS